MRLKIGGLGQKIEAQLNQLGPMFGSLLNLDLEHFVAGSPNNNADRFSAFRLHEIDSFRSMKGTIVLFAKRK